MVSSEKCSVLGACAFAAEAGQLPPDNIRLARALTQSEKYLLCPAKQYVLELILAHIQKLHEAQLSQAPIKKIKKAPIDSTKIFLMALEQWQQMNVDKPMDDLVCSQPPKPELPTPHEPEDGTVPKKRGRKGGNAFRYQAGSSDISYVTAPFQEPIEILTQNRSWWTNENIQNFLGQKEVQGRVISVFYRLCEIRCKYPMRLVGEDCNAYTTEVDTLFRLAKKANTQFANEDGEQSNVVGVTRQIALYLLNQFIFCWKSEEPFSQLTDDFLRANYEAFAGTRYL
jgi:hypothetical protein